MSPTELSTTPRTTLRRLSERTRRDRADLYAVLDAGLICHVGLVIDGSPRVIPTGYGRAGDTLYIHGSSGAQSLLAAYEREICVTVTHLDAIVYARSTFHHSVNYRSAMIFGTPHRVVDPDEKLAGLRTVVEHLAPGQWDVARRPNRKELAATAVLALSLAEASVKVRDKPPSDDEEDMALPVWAGLLPVRPVFGDPISDPLLAAGIAVPKHVRTRA